MSQLKSYIKSIIKELIDEESLSSDAGSYSTPLAFKSPKKTDSFVDEVQKEIIQEITYGKFKNEVAHRTKAEQLHKAIREVKRKIQEIDRIVEYTTRMKTELSESEGGLQHWNRTEQNIQTVKEMLNNVSSKLANL